VLADRNFAELFSDPHTPHEALEQETRPRAAVLVPVQVSCDDDAFTASCIEVSSGGVLLRTPRQLAAGTTVALEIGLPNAMVFVNGTVRSAQIDGGGLEVMGVQLVAVSDAAREAIGAYRAQLAARKVERFTA
jgi:hypothetical protein